MHCKIVLVLFLSFYVGITNAATYKWVDERGNTNFGDSVPDKYKEKAKKIEVKHNSLPDSQNESTTKKPSYKTNSTRTTNQEQSEDLKTIQSEPTTNIQINKEESCKEKFRRFKESQDCFAPYLTKGGFIKEEALLHCTALPKPDCTERNTK